MDQFVYGTKIRKLALGVSDIFPQSPYSINYTNLAIAFETAPGPITSTAFNRDGKLLAYAVSYDWHKGHGGMTSGHPNKIMLHACVDEEVKKRAPKPR